MTAVLWHLKVSNYNEKARWALDYKGFPHARRAAEPGRHRFQAKRLAGTPTMPILILDEEVIADSTEIIAELERRKPDPPLYPADPHDRRRALELEDFFDEELGPHARVLVVSHMLEDPELVMGAFFPDISRRRARVGVAAHAVIRKMFEASVGIDEQSVDRAWAKLHAAGRRFRDEVGPSGYLVGDSFSVADLTLAALVSPAVAPDEFPYPQPQRDHPAMKPVRDALDEHGLCDWVREMYVRHRGLSAAVAR